MNIFSNRSVWRQGAAALVAAATASWILPASALPLKYEMILDEKYEGVAVLQGDLRTVAWVADPVVGGYFNFSITAVLPGGGAPDDWTSTVTLQRRANPALLHPFEYTIASITGRHITNPAPDPGEASPGPLLLIGPPDDMFNAFIDLEGMRLGAPDPLSKSDEEPHDGPHKDRMVANLIDLNANAASVLTGDDREVRLRVEFRHHVPAPASLALALVALAGLAAVRTPRREASRPR